MTGDVSTDLADWFGCAEMPAHAAIDREGTVPYLVRCEAGVGPATYEGDTMIAAMTRQERRRNLLEQANKSVRELEAAGYRMTASWIAGERSGSSWIHEDGRRAEMLVVNGNRVNYLPAEG